MPVAGDLFSQQESNRRKSSWLLIGFIFFFAWVGFGGDAALYLLTADAAPGDYRHGAPVVGIVATLVAAALAWASWQWGDRQVLWATHAMELVHPGTPAQQQFINVVDEMVIASGMPRPTLYLVPDTDPNAFATGRDPRHAAIAVTDGLLDALDRDELQAVVAHEMAHIARQDTQLMTLVAAMVGSIALLSDGLGRFLWHSGRTGASAARALGGRGSRNVVSGAFVLVAWLATLVLAPLVSRLVAMAISRKREFLADATGAQYSRNPAALASALEKLEASRMPTAAVGRGAAHLCIVDPADRRFQRWKGLLGDVMASHPPVEERVRRLRAMAGRSG
ncbi:MAG: M48 family metallopeptidase [Gemmatimonadales bacterium]|nr:M48 family metallopeptidase [Gemmatimonadales bacterium]